MHVLQSMHQMDHHSLTHGKVYFLCVHENMETSKHRFASSMFPALIFDCSVFFVNAWMLLIVFQPLFTLYLHTIKSTHTHTHTCHHFAKQMWWNVAWLSVNVDQKKKQHFLTGDHHTPEQTHAGVRLSECYLYFSVFAVIHTSDLMFYLRC